MSNENVFDFSFYQEKSTFENMTKEELVDLIYNAQHDVNRYRNDAQDVRALMKHMACEFKFTKAKLIAANERIGALEQEVVCLMKTRWVGQSGLEVGFGMDDGENRFTSAPELRDRRPWLQRKTT